MSGPVCRYFMSNSCRFGDRCRFSHAMPESNYGSSYSSPNPYVLHRNQPHDRPNYNEPKQNWKQNMSYNDIQELIEKIRDEAKQVEYENMWPLTCLSVMREGANVPGWDDYSMEELRTAAYSAKVTGRFDEYVRFYQHLMQKAKESRSIFLRPGKRAEEVVRAMLEKRGEDDGKPSSNFSFAQVPAFSGFSSAASTGTNPLGSGSIFGGSPTSKAGSAPTTEAGSAFGSTQFGSGAGEPAPGMFAMAARGFDSNASQGSVLSDTDMETASESLLNQNSTSGVSPLHQNIFGQVAQQSVFGGAPTTKAGVFGGNTATPNVFGGSTAKTVDVSNASPSVFGAPTTSNVFGGPPSTSSVFGGAPASSPFSSNQGTAEANFNDSVYTPINELSESDLEQFKAATFTLSKLPLVPPPKEFC